MKVSVTGAELSYSTRGRGPVCIVLNAVGTRPLDSMLPDHVSDAFTLVFVDLRGSGQSTGVPTDLTFDVLADDLDAVRADLGVDHVAVLGHSIIGVLAIEFGRRRPEHISHVIAVGTPPYGDMARMSAASTTFFETEASEERKRLLRENMAQLTPGASMSDFVLAQTPMRFFDPSFDASRLLDGADSPPRLVGHILGTLTPPWDVTVDSSALSAPILLAHGRHDYVVPWVLWEGITEKLPDATLGLFERSGHQPFFEEPEAFVEVVRGWMARPDSRVWT